MSKKTPEQIKQFLAKHHIEFADCVAAFGESESTNPFVRAARKRGDEGELEIDEVAIVSDGGDPGAYVLSWLWISFGDADVGSAAMEDLCAFLVPRLTLADTERWPLLARLDWLQDLLSNFADEIDDIEHEAIRLGASPHQLTWQTDYGAYGFTPSSALRDLVAEGRRLGVPEVTVKAVEIYLDRYEEKLDAMLLVVQLPSEVAHAA